MRPWSSWGCSSSVGRTPNKEGLGARPTAWVCWLTRLLMPMLSNREDVFTVAEIVGGFATSHSSQLSVPVEMWSEIAVRDRSNPTLDFAAQELLSGTAMQPELLEDVLATKHKACQQAITQLGDYVDSLDPDVVLIVGDDQRELFLADLIPAFAVFIGDELHDLPRSMEGMDRPKRAAEWAFHGRMPTTWPASPSLGRHIAEVATESGFDIACSQRQLEGRSIGHAFTFVGRRIMLERKIPMLPVFVNIYEPNRPTPQRCLEFGRSIRRAIESWDSDARVLVAGSGGLTHWVIDADFDRSFLGLLESDPAGLGRLPAERFTHGTAEMLNWITAAGILEGRPAKVIDYVPAYRSAAATGCGMGFVQWD